MILKMRMGEKVTNLNHLLFPILMHIPKRYGQSKIDKCPFCQKHATTLNKQGVPVCASHKEELIDDLKCVCGSTLDMLQGKFGVFFSCMKCGNMNLRKVMEINDIKPKSNSYNNNDNDSNNKKDNSNKKIYNQSNKKDFLQIRKEITIRSDDPRYFD